MEGTSFADFKIYHPGDPDFSRPRGHMFTYSSDNGSNYNLGGTDTAAYPTGGINLAQGGASAPGHGIYVAPKANQVMYVNGMRFYFNHNAKALFLESYKDRISTDASTIQIMHNGIAFCSCKSPYCITGLSKEPPREVSDALATNEHLYGQDWPLDVPGRFDGDEGDSFGIRTSGGNGIYLGTSFAANKLTHFHIQLTGWVVDKVSIGNKMYEVIPR